MLALLFSIAFAPAVHYPASAAQAVIVRDLDGDGKPEIIASGNQLDERSALSILPNRGDGTFGPERLVTTALGEKIEDVADLDGDGIPDLITSVYFSNGIATYSGPSFQTRVPYSTATHGGPTRVVDIDGDGRPDLISFSFGSGNPVRVHVFRNGGAKQTFETSVANAETPSLRTFNGALEVLAGERSGQLAIFRYSNGALSVSRIDAGGGFDLSSVFADVNGDGIADIVDTTQSGVFVRIAKSDGTFEPPVNIGSHILFPTLVRADDFDGDGHLDLLVSDLGSPTLYCFRGDGTGAFEEATPIDAGAVVRAFDVADVNADGCLDIVTVNDDQTISVMTNRGPCRSSRHRAVRR